MVIPAAIVEEVTHAVSSRRRLENAGLLREVERGVALPGLLPAPTRRTRARYEALKDGL